jgi:membrane protein YqaA with SNARE-associated domain
MDQIDPTSAYGSLFALSFLASTVLPLGSEWLLVALLREKYSLILTVTVATIGNTLGACSTYALGFWGGRVLLLRLLRINQQALDRAQRLYNRYGVWVLLLSWVPVVGDTLCALCGLFRCSWWLFLVLVMAGKLIRYLFLAWTTVTVSA